MRHRSAEVVIYLVGVAVLGLSYLKLKAALPPFWFLAVVFAYLFGLRLLGRAVAKRSSVDSDEDEAQ